MESGYYWAKWNHARMTEVLIVFVSSNGDCFVAGADLPYDQDSFVFLSGLLPDPEATKQLERELNVLRVMNTRLQIELEQRDKDYENLQALM